MLSVLDIPLGTSDVAFFEAWGHSKVRLDKTEHKKFELNASTYVFDHIKILNYDGAVTDVYNLNNAIFSFNI